MTHSTDSTYAWHMGALFHWLVPSELTSGALALADVTVRAGTEPPPHAHTHEDELFYVLEGELEVVVGETKRHAGVGQAVHLPRGSVHGFRVLSPRARFLMLLTPGGLDRAFVATSEPAPCAVLPPLPEGPPPAAVIEHLLSVHGAHGVRFELGGAR